jgi:3-methylfumaryl-CoA hydratase
MQDSARQQETSDRMDPARAAALATVLGIDWQEGDALPPFFHQAYFWQALPEAQLGRDGHPIRGGLIPDLGLPRRMWAGGRLVFHSALRAGVAAQRTSRVEAVTRKDGRSGPLAFVTLRHEISQRGAPCVSEWQDLVYRADPAPGAAAPEPAWAPEGAEVEVPWRFSSTMLFRYSALTFNGHRIHYDLDYCREVEGYPGLVVHGPLLAQLMMLMAPAPLRQFRFRATAPLYHFETARLCQSGRQFWAVGPDGRLCMEAAAG